MADQLVLEKDTRTNRVNARKYARQWAYWCLAYQCVCCKTTKNLTLDHILPFASLEFRRVQLRSNLQYLCWTCHEAKTVKVDEYLLRTRQWEDGQVAAAMRRFIDGHVHN